MRRIKQIQQETKHKRITEFISCPLRHQTKIANCDESDVKCSHQYLKRETTSELVPSFTVQCIHCTVNLSKLGKYICTYQQYSSNLKLILCESHSVFRLFPVFFLFNRRMVRKGEKQKGNQPKPGETQPSILSFLTPTFAVLSSMGAASGPTEIVNDPIVEPSKKRPLDKGNEKISPAGKALRLEDEVSAIPQPENKKTENRNEV